PEVTEFGPDPFGFNVRDLKMEKVIEFLENSNNTAMIERINKFTEGIQKNLFDINGCTRPAELDDTELSQVLILQGNTTTGPRDVLLDAFYELKSDCPKLLERTPRHSYCTIDE
ncbi:unnamed protein product, partial [Owenia fusiformis]